MAFAHQIIQRNCWWRRPDHDPASRFGEGDGQLGSLESRHRREIPLSTGPRMRPDIHWIDLPVAGRLAIMARPRAGDWLADEIAGWRAAGIDIVVNLLEPAEIAE